MFTPPLVCPLLPVVLTLSTALLASALFAPDVPPVRVSPDVKVPVMSLANRYTFVIGEDRKVLKVESGSDAIDPEGAIVACPIRRPKKPDAGTPPADGGSK